MRAWMRLAVAMAAGTLVSGCSQEDGGSRRAAPSTSVSSASAEVEDDGHEDHVPADEAVPGAGEAADLVAAAAVRAWAQPQLSSDEWWAGFSPFLNSAGREAYSFTDPARIPPLRVESAKVVSPTSPTYTVVEVATDRGLAKVMLTRPNEVSGWLVDRFDLEAVDLQVPESAR